jgi:hypothetical protein
MPHKAQKTVAAKQNPFVLSALFVAS